MSPVKPWLEWATAPRDGFSRRLPAAHQFSATHGKDSISFSRRDRRSWSLIRVNKRQPPSSEWIASSWQSGGEPASEHSISTRRDLVRKNLKRRFKPRWSRSLRKTVIFFQKQRGLNNFLL